LRQLTNLQTVFAEGLVAARRLFAALDVEPGVAEAADARALMLTDATVRFSDVRFSYAADGVVLSGVDLEVRRGETVALVGPSGGGKSTILNLIPRFYDVTGGAITIDGQDLRSVTLASLRARIALVTQEPFLFDDSIRGNIAYGRPDADAAEVEAAARAADAHDFIAALPSGYDTLVGEAGARLSGGQRQRIAIARAFLKDAPILLLDEATSALDTESEAKVQAALNRLMAGRTTCSSPSSVDDPQRRPHLCHRSRRVVEQGTHPELLARRGPLRPPRRRARRVGRGRLKALIRSNGVQALLGWLLTAYLRLIQYSVRWRHENLVAVEPTLASNDPAMALVWHGRLPLCLSIAPQWSRRDTRALVSPSADGEFIAQALARAGFPAIRGSTAKHGAAAAKTRVASTAFRETLTWLKGGGALVVTPDGPRGPSELIAPGVVQIANAPAPRVPCRDGPPARPCG
jgi:ABC-type phosphate transport system ATPase subunit/lysophospholipid acyltransferase (LPLAT)-like uncharacterized protein